MCVIKNFNTFDSISYHLANMARRTDQLKLFKRSSADSLILFFYYYFKSRPPYLFTLEHLNKLPTSLAVEFGFGHLTLTVIHVKKILVQLNRWFIVLHLLSFAWFQFFIFLAIFCRLFFWPVALTFNFKRILKIFAKNIY